MAPLHLSPEARARALSIADLTDPAAGPHAMQLLLAEIACAVRDHTRAPLWPERGSPIVHARDNYDALRYPAGAVTREARYTRWLDEAHLLRSHTSAMVPGALRRLALLDASEALLVCPGIVYRRDQIDRLHVGEPHQLDLWHVRRGAPPLGDDALEAMIASVVSAALPGYRHRTEAREHPYTERGRQIDVEHEGTWIEIGECGLAHPEVLLGAGLARSAGWSGLAMGLGLDRLLMLRKHVPDIRLLRASDPRIAMQMRDLSRYREVSTMPPVRRDLSLAVLAERDVESLGDRVRAALGDDAASVEEVSVISETPYAALPPSAHARMGMQPAHKNVLVRVVLRDLGRTLTHAEANALRDRIYAALHEGSAHEWAADSA